MSYLWWVALRLFEVSREVSDRIYEGLLVRHYNSPRRHYHNLDHIRHVLSLLPPARVPEDTSLVLAAWFHDVIYDTRAKDNEQRSADYAREVLASLGVPADVREEAARLILLTRTHETTPDDARGHELLDADLAILAEDDARYDAYAAAIRREYDWVSDTDYRAGRRVVLERFLARPRIYFTAGMCAACEARARANLAREIAALS